MYKNKKIFVLGMGRSGVAVSKFLSTQNQILLTDISCENTELINELENLGINVIITKHQKELINENFDLLIKNPGIRPDNQVVLKAKELNIPVINEVEVSYNYLPEDVTIVGITGSNGKTTTTYLTYEILKMAGLPVHAGGNLGVAVCSMLDKIKEKDILVLEISSHQLLDLDKFKTNISAFTNLSEVHIDHFGTYENYKNNKLNIFKHHTDKDIAIINDKDEEVLEITKNIPSAKYYFGNTDCFIKDDKIWHRNEEVCHLNDIRIKGNHNYENVMCAILIAKQFDVSNETIREALANFAGVEHRIEFVNRTNDREFYNDSKATNNKSTIMALNAFDNPIILLLGGLDRGQTFDELTDHMTNVKEVVCYGETKENIKTYCEANNIKVTVVETLEEAVKAAYNLSEKGDTILLSPACASWDQFPSFEKRGEEFKRVVESLSQE